MTKLVKGAAGCARERLAEMGYPEPDSGEDALLLYATARKRGDKQNT